MPTPRTLVAAVACCALLMGCLDDPRDTQPDSPTPDGSAPDGSAPDGSAPDVGLAPDAAALDAEADLDPADPIEPAPVGCDEALEHYRTGRDDALACDGWDAPCQARLDGCCTATLTCVGGTVERALDCADDTPEGDCGRACVLHDFDNCALDPACAPFVFAGCGPAPEGVIEGPSCAPRWGEPCQDDGECGEGLRCQGFWIDPCAGEECDACGGETGYCVDEAG